VARCVDTLPIGQVMIAKIRLHALRHMTQGRLLSEIGAKLGSPFLEFGQLGPQAPDLAVDARQLRPGLLLADVTVSCLVRRGPRPRGEQSQPRVPVYRPPRSPAGLGSHPPAGVSSPPLPGSSVPPEAAERRAQPVTRARRARAGTRSRAPPARAPKPQRALIAGSMQQGAPQPARAGPGGQRALIQYGGFLGRGQAVQR
jgi:hypothetical protein